MFFNLFFFFFFKKLNWKITSTDQDSSVEIGVPTNNGGNLVERQRRVLGSISSCL